MTTWAARAAARFPQGSNGEYDFPDDLVPVFDEAVGCRLLDGDGREYVDYTMAWGSALVGHAHPHVVDAIARQARRGINVAAMSTRLVELAERVVAVHPWLERLRVVATGSEATLTALRIARGATGRSTVLKFEGAFHGSHVEGVANFFWSDPATLPAAEPTGTGGTPAAVGDLLVAPYNDLATAERLIAERAGELAAVIIDPVQRAILADPAFVRGLRAVTARCGVPLVFDEVVSGFRIALGGAVEHYGVVPDLVAFGKALGGGAPVAVVGGGADLMDEVREDRHHTDRYVWAASTTGGSPLTCAAALAVLDVLETPGTYDRLRAVGDRLRAGIAEVIGRHGLPVQTYGHGPLVQYRITRTPVRDVAGERTADPALRRALDLAMVRRGVFLNPMLTKIYVSLAHDDAALERYLVALDDALADPADLTVG
ncbi:MAG: aspartate aminotransferase family protein [Acidimicrobiales bacterium]